MPKGSKALKRFTKGVVATFTDAMLIGIFYGLEFSTGGYKSANFWEASRKADKDLEAFNHETLARAFRHLRRRGLVQAFKESVKEPRITAEGKRRLEELVPRYDTRRTWDGILYLVTYDIPVEHNRDRDNFRYFLIKIGCGMLQESLFVTPYNPKKLIEEFIDERDLHGTVLVSHMGKDGSIGDIELPELLDGVYGLSELNERYVKFIRKCESGEFTKQQAVFEFLSILGDDPQLPFELLPEDWVGDEAYELFLRLGKRTI